MYQQNEIQTKIITAAEETIGYLKHTKHQKFHDPEIQKMSMEQRKLRMDIENSTDTERIVKLKRID